MFQVLPKVEYKYLPDEFLILLNQFNAMFEVNKKSIFESLKVLNSKIDRDSITMYIYCNDDEKLEYYFDTNIEGKEEVLEDTLKTTFVNDEVFKVDKVFDIVKVNSISKYVANEVKVVDRYAHEKELVRAQKNEMFVEEDTNVINNFDVKSTKFMLNSLKSCVGIRLSFYYDKKEKLNISINVFATEGGEEQKLKNACSVIQQTTAMKVPKSSVKVKLHVMYNDAKKHYFEVSPSEFLSLFFIPYDYDKVVTSSSYESYIEDGSMNRGIYVGKSLHKAQDRDVFIPYNTAREHMFITGKTGAGKSSFFEMIIKSLIESKNGMGFTLLDPKHHAVTGVINIIEKLISDGTLNREEIYSKVKIIDFANKDAIFKMNILDKTVDITVLLDYFRDIFSSTGVRLEKIITNTVGALLCDSEEHYIGDILKFLKDNVYRTNILNRISKNEEAEIYYQYFMEAAEFKDEEISPIENRITPFIKNNHVKAMFNSGNDLDVRKWMDDGYVILFDLYSFSKLEMEIIVGYISLQYYLKCLKRPNEALSHFIFVDEAHDVQLDVFLKIKAKGRSQGLHLALMTQFLEQMKSDMLKSILELTATKIVLKQGDGGVIAKHMGIKAELLTELDKFQAFVKSIDENGKDITAFTKATPPYRYNAKGEIIPYKVTVLNEDNEEIEITNPLIHDREKELEEIINKKMLNDFPKSKSITNNVIAKSNKTSKLLSDDEVFL